MPHYDNEQGPDHAPDGDNLQMDRDLIPWLRGEFGMDAFVSEFPYFQYAFEDFEPDEDLKDRLQNDHYDDPSDMSDYLRQKGPFRTDVVGVSVDLQALKTRARRLGHLISMNQGGQQKRRNRRTYCTFLGDGPMTRDYWEHHHGYGGDEHTRDRDDKINRRYGEHSASRGFAWLKERGFLVPVDPNKDQWDAVDIPLIIYGRTHAFELKIQSGEWMTAMKQASRAECYADYRWVVMDDSTSGQAIANADDFERNGIGLITMDPRRGPEVIVYPERCTREVDTVMLNRYNVERWDLNERIMNQVFPEGEEPEWKHTDRNPITVDMDSVEVQTETPTVHGYTGVPKGREQATLADPGGSTPLTKFSGS